MHFFYTAYCDYQSATSFFKDVWLITISDFKKLIIIMFGGRKKVSESWINKF